MGCSARRALLLLLGSALAPSARASVLLTRSKFSRGRASPEDHSRVAELGEILHDLQGAKQSDDSNLAQVEAQITELEKKRDSIQADEARKAREITFLRSEVGQADIGTQPESPAVGQAPDHSAEEAADREAEAVVASVSGGTGTATSHSRDSAAADAGAGGSPQAVVASEQPWQPESAPSLAPPSSTPAARAPAAQELSESQAQDQAQVPASRASEPRAPSQDSSRSDGAYRPQLESADAADDSFKQFMKEEDGEDEMGDAAYEDSANALSNAIGWNRKDIEANADSAVKSLTQAIGGKQTVRALQGMMAGVR